ncbi:M81 family peptidase [Candidimonas sp. SYP-B2681]|uniref:M81 family metallopeptidase n=1 Tax=Candidimonas sp. SYP-B2681 TaxID=2497686 RepID=UPI000F8993E0|nr:M81 family metallopeptidase [Candidimonas sp. SYP-B2681]RTZ43213.1 M81 family peptidase [Candidimonas sp. SYP-B2681]
MLRIVYGGFQHETNTFAPDLADWDAFLAGGGWPGLVSRDDIWPAIAGANIPAAGFVKCAQDSGDTVIPTTWCAASPSAHVAADTYERIVAMIVDGISAALPVDAVYLDLHGAMVAQTFDDGEGELLRRVRAVVGPDVPIVASLDLHANVTSQMLREADILVAYRTYPHVDMAETGARAYQQLQRRLATGLRPKVAIRRLPFLIPICWQCTDIEPSKGLYQQLEALEKDVTHVSFTTGFPAADFKECSPVIWAYADDQLSADAAADQLEAAVNAAEALFAGKLYSADEAVKYAMEKSLSSSKPIVIADAQDNPGAGSNSDTTGMLRALLRNKAERAAIGLIIDPAAAAKIHAAGEGQRIRIAIGGNAGLADDQPFEGDFLIERLSDGKTPATGPYYHGFNLDMGLSACLLIEGVRVVLASQKVQMADQSMFRFVGVEPTEQAILVVKSAVHFRADFTPIAEEIIVGAAPGSMPMILKELPWKNLPVGIRLDPCGEAFQVA